MAIFIDVSDPIKRLGLDLEGQSALAEALVAQRSASLFRVAEVSLPKESLAAVQLLSSFGYSTGPFSAPAPRFSFRFGLLLQP